jgi:hypothetical protein
LNVCHILLKVEDDGRHTRRLRVNILL